MELGSNDPPVTEAGVVETSSGRFFDITKPKFKIEEIAHSLSHICRFNGHTRVFYSVASHSLLVSYIQEECGWGDPLEGLLHDAHEAYLVDLPSPYKPLFPDYMAADQRLERYVRDQWGLPDEKSEGCAKADLLALILEAEQLMTSKGKDYADPLKVRTYMGRVRRNENCQIDFTSHNFKDVRHKFIERYKELLVRRYDS